MAIDYPLSHPVPRGGIKTIASDPDADILPLPYAELDGLITLSPPQDSNPTMTPPANIWSFSHPPHSTSKGIPRKKKGRPCSTNAARERSRVRTLRLAFLELQNTLPSVPRDTKLSKLDVLVLATTYISHLLQTLNNSHPEEMTQLEGGPSPPERLRTEPCSKGDYKTDAVFKSDGLFRPVKKWPMRSRLYASIFSSTATTSNTNNSKFSKESTNMAAASSQTTRT